MFFPKKKIYLIAIVFSLFVVCSFGEQTESSVQLQTNIESTTSTMPVAIPVLSETKAQQANEDALVDYNNAASIHRKKIVIKVLITLAQMLLGAIIAVYLFYQHKKKRLKRSLLGLYKSQIGRLFYCTRFCLFDWFAIFLIFSVTLFFSTLAGQNAMMNGYNGRWYATHASPIALSIYNIGEARVVSSAPDSKLHNFLTKGSIGDLEFSSITNEEAIPKKYKEKYSFYESTGIAWLIALWWKLVGHPDWTTIYILFSLFFALTSVAAYCALRQVTGLIPSVFMGLLLSAYPSMMNQVVFGIRDGARALFCFIAIAVLLYLLKGGFRWKGTIISSVFLFIICSLSTYFRQDFIVLIPFIVIATIVFHGKLLANHKKKIVIILSIIMGLFVSFILPGTKVGYSMGHVLYIGMADHPFMDYLHFSADNYSKGISYADEYGFMFASGKAFREREVVNVKPYSLEYDLECRKEINNLVKMYPYDYFRLGLSSSIQTLYTGSRCAKRRIEWIESAPGYHLFQEKSKKIYQSFPNWLYLALLLCAMLLLLGGRFYQSMLFCLAIMFMSGIYMLQFNLRHYFYLMIIPLLLAGFLFNRITRISFILSKNWRVVWRYCVHKRKTYLLHCGILAGLFILAMGILLIASIIQTSQVKYEIKNLNAATTEGIQFQTKDIPSNIQRDVIATELSLPGFYNDILTKMNPEQTTFNEFLKIRFRVPDSNPNEKINVFAKYENTSEYAILPLGVGGIIHSSWTCPIRLTFTIGKDMNTLFIPVYFSRDHSPFTGVEFEVGGKKIEFESVERITDTKDIRTQSAFLVPENMDEMKYTGNIDWGKVFFGK